MKSWASLRLKIMLAALAAVGVLAAASLVQNSMLESELRVYAEKHADEFRDGNSEVAYTVTVAREFVIFGQPMGKITAFARPKGAEGMGILQAVDYHYLKQDGDWINTDSGVCTHEGCISNAEGAFARAASDS
jgi:hypothetical protein